MTDSDKAHMPRGAKREPGTYTRMSLRLPNDLHAELARVSEERLIGPEKLIETALRRLFASLEPVADAG